MILSTAAQANLFGLGAGAVWGCADFAGGFVTRRTFPALVVSIAHGLSLIAILAVLLFAGTPLPSAQSILYGLISGAAGGIGLILFYEGLAIGAMGLTSALAGVLTAIIPGVYSYFQQGRPTPEQLAGFIIAIAAIWMIAYTPGGKPHPRGLGLAVGAGIGFGLLLIFLEKAGTQSVGWALAFSRVASASIAVTASAVILIRRRGRVTHQPSHSVWRRIVPLAALGAGGVLPLSTTGRLSVSVGGGLAQVSVSYLITARLTAFVDVGMEQWFPLGVSSLSGWGGFYGGGGLSLTY